MILLLLPLLLFEEEDEDEAVNEDDRTTVDAYSANNVANMVITVPKIIHLLYIIRFILILEAVVL